MYRLNTATIEAAPATTGSTSALGSREHLRERVALGCLRREPRQQLGEHQHQHQPEEVHGRRVRDEAQRGDDVVDRLVAPHGLPHAERDREQQPDQRGQHGQDEGLGQPLLDELGDRLVERVRGAEVAVQQRAAGSRAYCTGSERSRPCSWLKAAICCGRGLRAEDPACGTPGQRVQQAEDHDRHDEDHDEGLEDPPGQVEKALSSAVRHWSTSTGPGGSWRASPARSRRGRS